MAIILLSDIIRHASHVFDISAGEITGQCREKRCVLPRFAVCKLARELTKLSYPEIGRRLGGRDHSTIIVGVRACDQYMQRDPEYAGKVRLVGELAEQSCPNKVVEPPVGLQSWGRFSEFILSIETRARRLDIWDREDFELIEARIAAYRADNGDFIEVWA